MALHLQFLWQTIQHLCDTTAHTATASVPVTKAANDASGNATSTMTSLMIVHSTTELRPAIQLLIVVAVVVAELIIVVVVLETLVILA